MLLLICSKIRAIRLFIACWIIAHSQKRESIVLTDGVLLAQSFGTRCGDRIIAVWLVVEVIAVAGRHRGELAIVSGLLGD